MGRLWSDLGPIKKWFILGDTVLNVALWINKQRREANVQRKSKGRCFKMLAPRMWLTWWGCAWRCGLHADQPSGADHPPPPIGSNGSKKEERRKSWNRIYQQLHTSNSYGYIVHTDVHIFMHDVKDPNSSKFILTDFRRLSDWCLLWCFIAARCLPTHSHPRLLDA